MFLELENELYFDPLIAGCAAIVCGSILVLWPDPDPKRPSKYYRVMGGILIMVGLGLFGYVLWPADDWGLVHQWVENCTTDRAQALRTLPELSRFICCQPPEDFRSWSYENPQLSVQLFNHVWEVSRLNLPPELHEINRSSHMIMDYMSKHRE